MRLHNYWRGPTGDYAISGTFLGLLSSISARTRERLASDGIGDIMA